MTGIPKLVDGLEDRTTDSRRDGSQSRTRPCTFTPVIPADILEKLITALAHWDGRGPGEDDMLDAGREMASAIMAVLAWDTNQ
jgi:hypothetical protein